MPAKVVRFTVSEEEYRDLWERAGPHRTMSDVIRKALWPKKHQPGEAPEPGHVEPEDTSGATKAQVEKLAKQIYNREGQTMAQARREAAKRLSRK